MNASRFTTLASAAAALARDEAARARDWPRIVRRRRGRIRFRRSQFHRRRTDVSGRKRRTLSAGEAVGSGTNAISLQMTPSTRARRRSGRRSRTLIASEVSFAAGSLVDQRNRGSDRALPQRRRRSRSFGRVRRLGGFAGDDRRPRAVTSGLWRSRLAHVSQRQALPADHHAHRRQARPVVPQPCAQQVDARQKAGFRQSASSPRSRDAGARPRRSRRETGRCSTSPCRRAAKPARRPRPRPEAAHASSACPRRARDPDRRAELRDAPVLCPGSGSSGRARRSSRPRR